MAKLTTVEFVNELQVAYANIGIQLSKEMTREVLDATFNVIVENVKVGNAIPINKVGTFDVKKIPAKTGTLAFGDKKGEEWTSEAKNTMKFKVSKNLEF